MSNFFWNTLYCVDLFHAHYVRTSLPFGIFIVSYVIVNDYAVVNIAKIDFNILFRQLSWLTLLVTQWMLTSALPFNNSIIFSETVYIVVLFHERFCISVQCCNCKRDLLILFSYQYYFLWSWRLIVLLIFIELQIWFQYWGSNIIR